MKIKNYNLKIFYIIVSNLVNLGLIVFYQKGGTKNYTKKTTKNYKIQKNYKIVYITGYGIKL